MSSSDTQATSDADKDRLSRVLGAAFLQHQVSQLERNVDSLSVTRGRGRSRGARGWGMGEGEVRGRGRATRGRGGDRRLYNPDSDPPLQPTSSSRGRSTELRTHSHPAAPPSTVSGNTTATQIRILDASVLIYALPVIKRWTNEHKTRLIVPLDAISTLDKLKSSPPPLYNLVRDATRWLDLQFSSPAPPQATASSAASMDVVEGVQAGLFAERTEDHLHWSDLEARYVPPVIAPLATSAASGDPERTASALEHASRVPEGTAAASNEEEGGEAPVPAAGEMPRYLRPTLQCSAWWTARAQPPASLQPSPPPSSPPAMLVVFCPPSAPAPPEESGESSKPDFSSGEAIATWAPQFGVEVRQLQAEEVERSREWVRRRREAMGRRRDGRGDRAREGEPEGRGDTGGEAARGEGSGRGRGEGRRGRGGGRGRGRGN